MPLHFRSHPVLSLSPVASPAAARLDRPWRWLLPVCLVALLAACGGGLNEQRASGAPNKRVLATGANPASVMINELVAGAWQGAVDEDGDAEDWVELHNPGDSAMDLTGFGLSHRTNSPFRWVFPAGTSIAPGGYLRVWLSKKDRSTAGQPLHTNFNLDSGADGVFLSASNATATGVLVDSAKPPLLKADHSWCRMPNGALLAAFQVCVQPTPGAANAGTSYASMLATPTFSLPGGFYATPQTVTISGPAGATVRFTTDGSEPDANSTAYSAPITVSTATVLRVAAFAPGAAPSLVANSTYVVDAALASRYQPLKAMFVTIAPADLARFEADDKTLLMRAGFEYVTPGNKLEFNMDGQGASGGNTGSATSPQRTMNVKGEDAFGVKDFPAVFWPSDKSGITKHRKFRLRNGSNDWGAAHLRDQLSQRISGWGPNLYAASATVAMFINGKYYAMMDLRERAEENLPANNLGLEKDYVDYISDPLLLLEEIKNGGAAARASYKSMHDFVVGSDMSVAANYARAKQLMNPESLAYDWALHMLLGNTDWPMRNVHVWRSPEMDNRWTWSPHDFDLAMDSYLQPEQNMDYAFTSAGSEVINSLLKNPDFRRLYLNTVADQMNVMSAFYMENVLDLMAADMRPYVPDFYARNNLGTPARWEAAIDALRFWMGQREPVYDQHTRAYFNLGQRQPITVAVNDTAMGSVQVNGIATGRFMSAANPRWSGLYYPGVPVTVTAQPKPGYTFVGWQGDSNATTPQITRSLQTPASSFPADNFSVRWRGTVEAPVSGSTQLQFTVDDGVRLWFDGVLLIDSWTTKSSVVDRSATVSLVAGRRHDLRIEYFDGVGNAVAKLAWRLPGSTRFVSVPRERLYPAGATATAPGTGTGLSAEYFANASLIGAPAFQQVEAVNVNWGSRAPVPLAAPVVLTAVFAPAGPAQAPAVPAIAAQTGLTGSFASVPVLATDPVGAPLTFSARTLPAGLAINARSGMVYGFFTRPGSYASTITVSNGAASTTIPVTWTVRDRPGSGTEGSSPGWGVTPPPNQAPTVALTTPSANASFPAGRAITVAASAADADGSVSRVEFFDGGSLIGSASAAPFSISWLGAASGSHTLTARATDNAGASTTSATVTITVAPAVNQPPVVAITAPPGNAGYTTGQTITVVASASDPDGSIAKVEFFERGALLGTVTSAPYTVSRANVGAGNYTVTAVATDNQGARTTSAPVTLTVGNGSGGGSGTGLRGSYYANATLSGTPVLNRTEAVNFDWGTGSPGTGVGADLFSVRWRGTIEAPTTGTYVLQTQSDDGVRVWVNGNLVINNWTTHSLTTDTSPTLYASAGQRYTIVIEYMEQGGAAAMRLLWRTPGSTSAVPVPVGRLFPQ